jgi:anti-sigma factor RsiW
VRRRVERAISAYRDGELSERRRQRVAARLATDAEAARLLDHTQGLGSAVRAAWTEGPASPPADELLAILRPALREIDAELEASRHAWLTPIRELFRAPPPPASGGAAAVRAAAFLVGPAYNELFAPTTPGSVTASVEMSTVYSLEGESSIFVFEGEGADAATVIWVNEPGTDDLSGLTGAGGFG